MNNFKILHDAIEQRFPNAKFVVSCFNTVEEIESKKLTNDDVIICQDTYLISRMSDETKVDSFVVHKRKDADAIYFKDVIDELIRVQFVRNDCDYKFLEGIYIAPDRFRNKHSVKICTLGWGS